MKKILKQILAWQLATLIFMAICFVGTLIWMAIEWLFDFSYVVAYFFGFLASVIAITRIKKIVDDLLI